jgi:hypothetical protein
MARRRADRAAARRPQLRGGPLAHTAGHDLCPRPAPRPPDRPARPHPPALAASHQRPSTWRPVPVAPHPPDGHRTRPSVRDVRNKDGIQTATGEVSGSCCGRTAAVQHGWLGWPRRPDTDHAHLRRPWPAVALVPVGSGCAPHKLPCRGGCRGPTPCPHRWTGVRETTGYCPGRQIVVDTGMAIDASLATCAGHQPSGGRSLERPFRKQRTVNPLMVPARYNFLYFSSRPALRAAACGGRPRPADPPCDC